MTIPSTGPTIHWAKLSVATVGIAVLLPSLGCTLALDRGPRFVAGVLLALVANWALIGGAIVVWRFVASGVPSLERTWPGFLFGCALVQILHFVAMIVTAILLSPLLFLSGPHDMGGGVLIGLMAAIGPSIPSVLFGFVAPRIFSSRLRPGAFLASSAEAT